MAQPDARLDRMEELLLAFRDEVRQTLGEIRRDVAALTSKVQVM